MGHSGAVGVDRVGPVGIGVIGLLLAVAAVAVWLAAHQPRVGRLERLGAVPLIGPVLRFGAERLDALISPVAARLGLRGAAVVGLLAGLLAVGAAAVGFTELLDDVLDGEGIVAFDQPAAAWLAGHRERWLTTILLVLTRLGEVDAQTVWLVLVCAVAALRARSWVPVMVGVAGGGGIGLVIVVAKHLVGRARPGWPFALVPTPGFSFPSGHATGAAAIGMLSAWMLCRWVVRRWALQVGVWAVTVAVIALIGFSRPYLGVHFVTDVLAGWLLGAGWATAAILAASWWSRTGLSAPTHSGALGGPQA